MLGIGQTGMCADGIHSYLVLAKSPTNGKYAVMLSTPAGENLRWYDEDGISEGSATDRLIKPGGPIWTLEVNAAGVLNSYSNKTAPTHRLTYYDNGHLELQKA